jgi:hypothetical protein
MVTIDHSVALVNVLATLGDPGEGDAGANPHTDLDLSMRSVKSCLSDGSPSYSALTAGGLQQGPAWT